MTAQEAKQKYEQYINDPRNSEPEFVRCTIQWHDDKSFEHVFIALFPYYELVSHLHGRKLDGFDEHIFYYCEEGIGNFLQLFNGEGDFSVVDVSYYCESI